MQCWAEEAKERPSISTVRGIIKKVGGGRGRRRWRRWRCRWGMEVVGGGGRWRRRCTVYEGQVHICQVKLIVLHIFLSFY